MHIQLEISETSPKNLATRQATTYKTQRPVHQLVIEKNRPLNSPSHRAYKSQHESPISPKATAGQSVRGSVNPHIDELIPAIEKKQQFLEREKTCDIFLKKKDMEVMLGIKNGIMNAYKEDSKHQSPEMAWLIHSKLKKELEYKLKNKKGKMFLNELWSKDFYSVVVNSAKMNRGVEGMISPTSKHINYSQGDEEILKAEVNDTSVQNTDYDVMRPSFSPKQSLIYDQSFNDRSINSQAPQTAAELSTFYMQSDKQFFRSVLRDATSLEPKIPSTFKKAIFPQLLTEESVQSTEPYLFGIGSSPKASMRSLVGSINVCSPEKKIESGKMASLFGFKSGETSPLLPPEKEKKPRKKTQSMSLSTRMNFCQTISSRVSLVGSPRNQEEILRIAASKEPEKLLMRAVVSPRRNKAMATLIKSPKLQTPRIPSEVDEKMKNIIDKCIDASANPISPKGLLQEFTRKKQTPFHFPEKKVHIKPTQPGHVKGSHSLQIKMNLMELIHSQGRQKTQI